MTMLRDGLLAEAEAAPGDEVHLLASWCAGCDRSEFPARRYCPGCGGAVEEKPLGAEATVTGFTAVLHAPPGALVEAPYGVVVGSFTEGISVLGLLVDAGLDDIAIGDPLRTVAVDIGGRTGYGFLPRRTA